MQRDEEVACLSKSFINRDHHRCCLGCSPERKGASNEPISIMSFQIRSYALLEILDIPFFANIQCLQAEKHVEERHRHRYEVNPAYIRRFEAAGLNFVGKDESGERMEIIENSKHPFFIAAQFHPEFKSRPFKPSPLFLVSCCILLSNISSA